MVKKKRNSILVVHEGYREGYFLEHIAQYNTDVKLNLQFCGGISGTKVVGDGIKYSDRGVRVFAFFDEDFQFISERKIQDEILDGLEIKWKLNKGDLKNRPYKDIQTFNTLERNPILVVSWPKSIEGFILRLMGNSSTLKGMNTAALKSAIDALIVECVLTNEDNNKILFYENKITTYEANIAALSPSDLNYNERRKYLGAKIEEFKRYKNKVSFMRFLNTNLPLSVLSNNRGSISEIDILLKAFGL